MPRFWSALLLMLLPLTGWAQKGVPQSGFPNWQERMVLMRANRSRAQPTADTKACTSTTVMPPLVWRYNFNRSARFHSSNMQKTGKFQHASPCTLVSDLSTRFAPNGTCDGSASCACVGGTATCNTTCTTWSGRISLFGSSANAENIAVGYGSPEAVHTGWMNSAGHCAAILGSYSTIGVGWLGNYWTQNFGGGGSPGTEGPLIAGGHEPQFSGASVAFRVNYYSTAGGPQQASVNIDGTCSTMTKERGTVTNGTYLSTVSLAGTACRRYVFTFKNSAGTVVRLPETGSYGVGGSLATCPDWTSATPVACGTADPPPTVATQASATPNPVTGTTSALSVLGADNGGEASLTYTWSATGPAAVSFSANGSNAAKSSTATFTRAGSYSLSVTLQDSAGQTVTSTVAVTVNQTITSVVVTPATSTVAAGGTKQFSAAARDQFAQALATAPVFSWTTSGGGTLSGSGLYTAGNVAGGPHTVTASSGGKSGTASISVTNSAPTVASAASASPNPVAGATTSLAVLGADDGGEAALSYTWTATGPAAVSFSPNATNAAKSSTATFTRAGAYSFTVTVRDAGGQSVTSTVAVTVNQSLTSISVSPATATVNLNTTQQFTASGQDQFSQPMALAPTYSWTVSGGGAINASGLFTSGSTAGGPHTITASSGGKSGTAQVSVIASGPTVATAASASPNPVTSTSTALSVLGADNGGEAALSYTWAGTGPAAVSFSVNGTNAAKSSTATFTRAGAYTFTVSIQDAGGLSVTSTVAVTVNQTLTLIAVSPASTTVSLSATQQFTALAQDQFGQPLAAAPAFSWTVSGGGSVNSSGLFTAGGAPSGPHTLTASAGSKSGTASLTVAANAPTVASAASASPSPVTGTSTTLTALGADDGGESALSYLWTASGPAAVGFSANDGNAAKSSTATFTRAGAYSFTVTIRDAGGLFVTSTVAVDVAQTPTSLLVIPANASVAPTGAQQFDSTVDDQFGAALVPPPAVIWTVSGGGAISSSGLFSAGGTPGGPFTITAASAGLTTLAQVTVTGGSPPAIQLAPTASPNPVTGTTSQLAVTASDDGGEASLTYSWSATGPAAVTFSANSTNAAKNTSATFSAAGSYSLQVVVVDAVGFTDMGLLTVQVVQTATTVAIQPPSALVLPGGTVQFTATTQDQFGAALTPAPTLTWTVEAGGTIGATGLFTAGTQAGGPFTVIAATGAASGVSSVTISAGPDTTPPQVALLEPSADQQVLGLVKLRASASDDVGLTRVEFLVEGAPVGQDSTAPYELDWDSRAVADGLVMLQARAVDLSANTGTSAPVRVRVSNGAADTLPPRVSITTPVSGATVSGPVRVEAQAEDEVGVVSVSFELDGLPIGVATSTPWAITFQALGVDPGEHSLRAVARDQAGNSGASPPVILHNVDTGLVSGGCGCGLGGSGTLALLGLGMLLRRRRPRYRANRRAPVPPP